MIVQNIYEPFILYQRDDSTMRHIKTKAAWDKAMEFPGVLVIDFYMSWCMPCGKLKPVLAEIDAEYKAKSAPLLMVTIEIDDLPAMSRHYKVGAVPALFFFVNGKESGTRIVGFKGKEVVVERIEKELKKIK